MKEGDPEAVFAATAQPYKTLNTLGIYEQRRRRAANAMLDTLTAMLEARKEEHPISITGVQRPVNWRFYDSLPGYREE